MVNGQWNVWGVVCWLLFPAYHCIVAAGHDRYGMALRRETARDQLANSRPTPSSYILLFQVIKKNTLQIKVSKPTYPRHPDRRNNSKISFVSCRVLQLVVCRYAGLCKP